MTTTNPRESQIYYIIRDEQTMEQLSFYPMRIKSDAHRLVAAMKLEFPHRKLIVVKRIF